jgi:uncharacterized membrane protein YeaQ/YmgE (transglycosylase-associated protein family)
MRKILAGLAGTLTFLTVGCFVAFLSSFIIRSQLPTMLGNLANVVALLSGAFAGRAVYRRLV